LIGGVPTLPLIDTKPVYKEKPKFNRAATKWTQKAFTIPARKDGLMLKHWVPANDASADYPFDKFDKSVDVIEYTDVEYETISSRDADGWTREETDYLWELCKRFDLRFVLVHDRYAYSGDRERTMEDLKDRYYSVCRRVHRLRNLAVTSELQYEKERDVNRKRALEQLILRHPDQVAEEEAVFAELRRIQQQHKRWQREHEHLTRVMDVREASSMVSHTQFAQQGSLSHTPKHAMMGSNSGMSTPSMHATPQPKRKGRKSRDVSDLINTPITTQKTDKFPTGATLRSSRIPIIRAHQISIMVNEALRTQFKIGLRPLMATQNLCTQFQRVQSTMQRSIELKKQLDRINHEIQVEKERLKLRKQKAEDMETPSKRTRR
jgi:DNA methyltransferase 1-associated protein 1